ncbi:hypothetical protein HY995_02550 [Candidatus Micrarchaeota archaeon]|nr:hypothetical protein [Candidatus Micrarchaeota archaeon]
MGMHGTCKKVMGVLVLASGVALAMGGWGYLTVTGALKVAGVLFVLKGLSALAHSMNMCSQCSEACGHGGNCDCGHGGCCMQEKAAAHRGRRR